MAVVVRSKWRKGGGERTIEERAGVIGANIWKISMETFRRMEREGFRVGGDRQTIRILTEFIAFLVQVTDRVVYGQIDEDQRATLVNALGHHLANTVQSNLLDLFGPGEYRADFITALNERGREYAECEFRPDGPGYAFLRLLGEKVFDAMAETDNKWVIEHVMEIEAPEMIKPLRKSVGEILGIRTG